MPFGLGRSNRDSGYNQGRSEYRSREYKYVRRKQTTRDSTDQDASERQPRTHTDTSYGSYPGRTSRQSSSRQSYRSDPSATYARHLPLNLPPSPDQSSYADSRSYASTRYSTASTFDTRTDIEERGSSESCPGSDADTETISDTRYNPLFGRAGRYRRRRYTSDTSSKIAHSDPFLRPPVIEEPDTDSTVSAKPKRQTLHGSSSKSSKQKPSSASEQAPRSDRRRPTFPPGTEVPKHEDPYARQKDYQDSTSSIISSPTITSSPFDDRRPYSTRSVSPADTEIYRPSFRYVSPFFSENDILFNPYSRSEGYGAGSSVAGSGVYGSSERYGAGYSEYSRGEGGRFGSRPYQSSEGYGAGYSAYGRNGGGRDRNVKVCMRFNGEYIPIYSDQSFCTPS